MEAFTRLTLLYNLTWKDLIYILGQMLIPDLRALVLSEATTFGNECLECETRENREHEIALLPTGCQVIPITESLCHVHS